MRSKFTQEMHHLLDHFQYLYVLACRVFYNKQLYGQSCITKAYKGVGGGVGVVGRLQNWG